MEPFTPQKVEKDVISIRIDLALLKQVDAAAAKSDISRNELINQCIAYALNHLSPEDRDI